MKNNHSLGLKFKERIQKSFGIDKESCKHSRTDPFDGLHFISNAHELVNQNPYVYLSMVCQQPCNTLHDTFFSSTGFSSSSSRKLTFRQKGISCYLVLRSLQSKS